MLARALPRANVLQRLSGDSMRFVQMVFAIVLVSMVSVLPVSAGEATPKKWRILYVEGGPYTNYQQLLAGTARGLARLGLIANGNVAIPAETESSREMWEWLSKNAGGNRIEFLRDGYYSANWDSTERERTREAIVKRIREKKDVDMIWAFGTWSGLDMAGSVKNIPIFSMSVSDAVGAGIARSWEDSGQDNLHAQVEPGRYKRQIAVFHEVFRFKRLGIPYEDTPEGRSTCAMDEIEAAADELGIELVRCTTPLDLPDPNESFQNLQQCVKTLSTSSDAIYLTLSSGIQGERMVELLQPIIDAGIPSFSQGGPNEVKLGVLMSLAQASFLDWGQFEADCMAKVINGETPRNVNQIFEPALGLAINLKMAMLIGWNPPLEILAAVDEIYQQIQNAQ